MEAKQITETLFAVVVPVQPSNDYEIVRCQDNFNLRQLHYPSDVYMEIYQNYGNINIGEFDCVVKGEVTHESISFDFEEYVEKKPIPNTAFVYKNYMPGVEWLYAHQASFYSLLASKGRYWENPLESYKTITNGKHVGYDENSKEWQAAEASKLTKEQKLIIIEKI